MKTLVLTINNIKRFLRNWESMLLLIGFPLLIVAAIFSSFSPDNVNVPFGMIDNSQDFDSSQFKNSASSFANIKDYENLENCIDDVKSFKIYGCAVIDGIEGKDQYKLNIYYDNTREVIDKTILGGLRRVASKMKLNYSRERVSTALSELESLNKDIKEARNGLKKTDHDLEKEIEDIDERIKTLKKTRNNLNRKFKKMDETANEVERTSEQLEANRTVFYQNSISKIEKIDTALAIADSANTGDTTEINQGQKALNDLNQSLVNYNNQVNRQIENVNKLIEDYNQFRSETKKHMAEINRTITDLEDTKSELRDYRQRINRVDSKLASMESRYSVASSRTSDEIVNLILMDDKKIYNPDGAGPDLLILQTIYSTLLLLVSLFVSILISKFVTLSKINSGAKRRIEITPGTFLPEYLSVYITSVIISSVPIICVLVFGQHFFNLKIFETAGLAALTLFLFNSSMINLGIGSAHLIRNKSITLLVGSFIIIFLIFFSGFILPIEMMRTLPKLISTYLPGNLTREAFDATVLFGKSFKAVQNQIIFLGLWNIVFASAALLIKKLNDTTF